MAGRNGTFFSGLSIKRTLIRLDLGYYWLWAALRILLTLTPQTGYIHPDEYFQTVEVFAGDVFDIDVSLPWEFNSTNPIRSVVMTYLTMRIPLSLLKIVSEFLLLYCDINILSSYFILTLPRLAVCFLSFISDYCLYRICYLYGQNYKERLVIYSSSFVCLIFMTRTFSNTIEVMCFNLLLLTVASCMAESEKINYQNDYLKTKYNGAVTISDRVRIHKLIKSLPKHSLSHCLLIASITIAGVFNRPTFICYAISPVFCWIQRGMGSKNVSFLKEFHSRIILLAVYSLPSLCFFIFMDSAYYGYITWGEIINKRIDMNNFVITPLNFLKYNLDNNNLGKHGLHPRFLHILVNIPLLYNVLGISALIITFKMFYRGTFSHWTLLPKSQSITGMMTLSYIFPVVLLSVIPHQEPRFIIPVLLPLVFLYSHLIKDFQEHCTSVIPFRKRCQHKPKEVMGILNIPMKCVNFFRSMTENFDNRYNVNGRSLTMLKNAEKETALFTRSENMKQNRKATVDEKSNTNGVQNGSWTDNKKNKSPKKRNYLLVLWFFLNAFSVLFWGYFHQGGVYPLASYISQDLTFKPHFTVVHLVTSHVYSFPQHLLMLKNTRRLRFNQQTGKRYKVVKDFFIYELGTENMENIYVKLNTVLKVCEARKKEKIINYKLYYALPLSLLDEFEHIVSRFSNFSYSINKIFYPHLSTEAFPALLSSMPDSYYDFREKDYWCDKKFDCLSSRNNDSAFLSTMFSVKPIKYIINYLKQFGLVLVRIKIQI